MHTRETIRRLQLAHAGHIAAIYAGLAKIPGNPRGVEVKDFGPTRVYCAQEDRLENRAIFTGNESPAELEQVTAFFAAKGRTCFVELNPANFYRSDPFSWQAEFMPALLALGYRPDAFRCVWAAEARDSRPATQASPVIEHISEGDPDRWIDLCLQVQGGDTEQRRLLAEELRHGQSAEGWHHYIGYEGGKPVSTSTLFIQDGLGYLKWGFTQEACRGRGHQQAHIGRRMADAFARGCTHVFSVTDIGITSGANLQRCGLTLAYNYVLMVKAPPQRIDFRTPPPSTM